MSKFFKSFIVWSLIFWMIILGGSYLYIRVFDPLDNLTDLSKQEESDEQDNEEDSNLTPFEKAVEDSDRINVLIVGLEHTRTDTIMLASYNRKTDEAELISIPRDTYYVREGYENRADYKKINAIYGTQGIGALIKAVSDLTGMPINEYVLIDYQALVAGVNAVGGVEIDVKQDMYYDDPSPEAPTHIDIKAGYQTLDGDTALGFLRFRHGYANGDIGRITAQQQFVDAMGEKLFSLKLIDFINAVYPYIEKNTSFNSEKLIALASELSNFSMDNYSSYTLPGDADMMEGLSYYVPDEDEILKIIYKMYGIIK